MKLNKFFKILFSILTPLAILSVISTASVFNYLYAKHDEIINLSDINKESLDMTGNFYHYDELGYRTVIGVDLSEHNKEVNFKKLKDQGIEFAFIRLGWRGYIVPDLHLDAKFEEYYKNAKEAGIKIGVYFFSQAITEDEAKEEARFVIDNLANKEIDLYVAFDYESIEASDARTNNLTKHQRTNNARAFLTAIEESSYSPMLYTNMYWIKFHYDYLLLTEYPIWYAQYSRTPQYTGKHIIWQYATEMIIDGVSGRDGTDLNLMIIKEDAN